MAKEQKLQSGNVRVNDTITLDDGTRKRYFASGRTTQEAEAALQAKVAYDNDYIRFGESLKNGEVNLFEAIEALFITQKTEILDGKGRPKRETSIARDKDVYMCQIKPFKQFDKLIKDLYPKDFSDWRKWVNQQCVKNTHKPLAADTKNRALTILRAATRDYYNGTCNVSPLNGISRWRRNKPNVQALVEDEIQSVFAYCNANPSDNADIVMLIILIYCRPGEALALKVKDYDADKHMLHINRTVIDHNRLSEDGRCKTADSIRDVAVPQLAHDIIMRHCGDKDADDLLFPAPKGAKGKCKDESDFNHYFKRLLKHCGIEKNLHAHNLRTTGISYAQYKGASVYGVAGNAGHSNISTTLRNYTMIYNSQKTDATNIMDKAFSRQADPAD